MDRSAEHYSVFSFVNLDVHLVAENDISPPTFGPVSVILAKR
jgi:hypothetical protein